MGSAKYLVVMVALLTGCNVDGRTVASFVDREVHRLAEGQSEVDSVARRQAELAAHADAVRLSGFDTDARAALEDVRAELKRLRTSLDTIEGTLQAREQRLVAMKDRRIARTEFVAAERRVRRERSEHDAALQAAREHAARVRAQLNAVTGPQAPPQLAMLDVAARSHSED